MFHEHCQKMNIIKKLKLKIKRIMETKVKTVTLEIVKSKSTAEILEQVDNLFEYVKLLDEKYDHLKLNCDDLITLKFKIRECILNRSGSTVLGRIKRHWNKFVKCNSISNLNRVLRTLCKSAGIDVIKIESPKHREIQALRKEWKELNKKAEEALKKYKEVKGDFYKQNLPY
jgi:hypothetical protein